MSQRGENLVRPPRTVPLSLTVSALFGGFINQFGWFFFTFGMFFVVLFCREMDFSDHTRFRGALATAAATILEGQETDLEINEEDVVCWSYQYEVDGQTYAGQSFTNGWRYEEGQQVQVEYPVDDVTCTRIVGSRRSKTPIFILFVIGIFPTVGALFWIAGIRQGLKARRLLANGLLAGGRLVGKEPTNMTINDQTVYELKFAFQPDGFAREFHCTARSHQPESLEDEAEEPLLYLPSDPQEAVMLDSLPSGAVIGADGTLRPKSPLLALLLLLSPALGIALLLGAVTLIAG